MTTYYYIAASKKFLEEEALQKEVLKERKRNYTEKEKEIDFWMVEQPAFLDAPELATQKAKCPQPAAAVISTNPTFINWLKLRLEYVLKGSFEAPSEHIPDPLASLATKA
ncbi:MAG: MgPME-cyclase complex family protein [Cyanobacteria bacterium P01_F01_bin.150]